MVRVGVLNDIDVEELSHNALPNIALTNFVLLLLELALQDFERESISLQLVEKLEYCTQWVEKFLILHENVELIVEWIVLVFHDLIHDDHYNW